MGQVGFPDTDESVVGEAAIPVTIVQRNEAGEETGRVSGVRIGSGDNARVLTLEELASINQSRRRAGQDEIIPTTPPFSPIVVDTSGAAVNDATSNTNTDADANANANDSNDNNMSTNNTTSGSIYGPTLAGEGGGGGGVRQIRILGGQVITIPEGKTALQHVGELVALGELSQEVYDNLLERQPQTSTDLPSLVKLLLIPNFCLWSSR